MALNLFKIVFDLSYEKEPDITKRVFNLIRCNFVRLLLIGQGIFCIYYLLAITGFLSYISLILCLIVILLDAIYVSVFRDGKEYKWFSISKLAYTLVMLVTIWQIIVIKYETQDYRCTSNGSNGYPMAYTNYLSVSLQMINMFVSFPLVSN